MPQRPAGRLAGHLKNSLRPFSLRCVRWITAIESANPCGLLMLPQSGGTLQLCTQSSKTRRRFPLLSLRRFNQSSRTITSDAATSWMSRLGRLQPHAIHPVGHAVKCMPPACLSNRERDDLAGWPLGFFGAVQHLQQTEGSKPGFIRFCYFRLFHSEIIGAPRGGRDLPTGE